MVGRNPKVVEAESKAVNIILDKLRKHEISLERAQEISRYILQVLREDMSDERFLKIVPKLDDVYYELAPVVLEELIKFEETVGKAIKEKVSQLIKEGKIEAASELADKYFKMEET